MDAPENRNPSNTISWISSLAITVTCCAVQFVVFAGYIFDLKESISILRIRSDLADERMKEMSSEMDTMHRHGNVQQIQILPSPNGAPVQLPLSLTPQAPEFIPVGTVAPNTVSVPVGTAAAPPPVEVPKITPESPVKP